jgi:hypothetical protein
MINVCIVTGASGRYPTAWLDFIIVLPPHLSQLTCPDLLPENWAKNEEIFRNAKILRKGVKRSHFTSEQIVFALRQAESGTQVAEVCRKMGIVEQTFYRWKKKYIGMGVAVFGDKVNQ